MPASAFMMAFSCGSSLPRTVELFCRPKVRLIADVTMISPRTLSGMELMRAFLNLPTA